MATKPKPTGHDYLALFVIGLALIDVKGAIIVLTQAPGTLSSNAFATMVFFAVAVPTSLYLVVRYARMSSMGDVYGLFALFFAFFVIWSTAQSLLFGSLDGDDRKLIEVYVFQFIFISGVYFWAAQLSDAELAGVLRCCKAMFLIAALAIILSPVFPYYQGVGGRAGGFYINQGRAASAALFCLVLVAAFPARTRLLTIVQGGVGLTALILTFSRTGLLMVVLLGILSLFRRPSIKSAAIFIAGLIIVGGMLWSVLEYDLFNLSWEQRQRLADVVSILTGDGSQKSYDDRGILFDSGLKIISEQFPWGAGIGKFHHLEGVARHHTAGFWLGVHNAYLMILGEGGLATCIAFLAFWARLLWKLTMPSPFFVFSMGTAIVILGSMLTSHAIFNDKVIVIMLAFLMVVAARLPAARKINFTTQAAQDVPQP